MLTPEEKTALQGEFQTWLAGTDSNAFHCKLNSFHVTLIRVFKNMDFDYLYCQRQYHSTGIERGAKFEYAGVYCKRDGILYDGQYEIQDLMTDYTAHGVEALRKALKAAVRLSVEVTIANDRDNLSVTEITSERERGNMEYALKHSAPEKARAAYLSGEYDDDEPFALTFQCDYSPDNWTEDSLLAYILNPAQYAETEAAAFIESNQEDMLADFLYMDAVAAEYKALTDNPANPVHRVKRIMAAVGASSAKTVTVTICKDGVPFTFKAEASQFRMDCTSSYNEWNIKAPDRKEFERLFGRSGRYTPNDIVRIEYARAVLYQ